nr:MAG TPA: hypothetical protein [Caudoviricetes sp.]
MRPPGYTNKPLIRLQHVSDVQQAQTLLRLGVKHWSRLAAFLCVSRLP